MARLVDTLPESMRGGHAASSDGLLEPVAEALRPGDLVTVKGSLGSRMAPVVEALLALDSETGNGGEIRRAAGGRG